MVFPVALKKYHDMGLILIPLTVKDNKKIPLIEYKEYKDKYQDLITLQGLYETFKDVVPLHWAVYCINGIIGIDFDAPLDYETFFSDIDTLTTKSPNGGYHAFIKSLTPCKAFDIFGIEIKINVLCTIFGDKYDVFKDITIKEFDDADAFFLKKFPKLKIDKKIRNINIKDVIEKYTKLNISPKNHIFISKCPIHNDKENEHLYVYENTNSWYCFKCKKGGNAVDFIKNLKGVKNKDALNLLEELLDIEIVEKEETPSIQKSTIRLNNILYEQIKKNGDYQFVNFNSSHFEYHKEIIEIVEDVEIKYIPCKDEEIIKEAVVICNAPVEYSTLKYLINQIDKFIYKWLDIPDKDRKFYTYYILQTWVFEKFHTIGYARALGDTGVGKTRFLDTIGGLCYKPMFTVGAIGAAPIFRILDKHRGTLIIDEANFGKSDETEAIITILNAGWEKGKPILRCNKDQNMALNTFDAFSPKVLGTRKKFTDTALEARCYTVSITQTDREDIPANLDDSFFTEKNLLSSQLMAFRLKNINTIKPKPELQEQFKNIEPRLIQKALPLASIVESDPEALTEFIKYIYDSQEDLIDERQGSQEGKTALAILDLYEDELKINNSLENIIISGEDIATKLNENLPEKRQTNSQRVGKTLKTLGFSRTQKQIKAPLDTNPKKRVLKRALDTNPKLLSKMIRRYTFLDDENYPLLKGAVSSVSSTYGMNLNTNLLINTVTGSNQKQGKNQISLCPTVLDTLDTLDTKIEKQGNIWQEKNRKSINSLTKTEFIFWYCEQNKNDDNTPSQIIPIVEKIFKITPETPHNTGKKESIPEEKAFTPEQPSTDQNIIIIEDQGETFEVIVE